MANRLASIGRRTTLAATALILGSAVGCAFPNGSRQGDPLLGNFHRPIVPTPPPERGGMGPDSPAYDAGARIGAPGPDVPGAVENSGGLLSLPPLTTPNLLSGAKMPFSTPENANVRRPSPATGGARLQATDATWTVPSRPAFALAADSTTVAPRAKDPTSSITSAAAFVPTGAPETIKLVKYELLREPSRIQTVEEGQSLLATLGAKGMKSEQLISGEWAFACTIGLRPYEARGADQLDALRRAVEQVQRDR